ncbi:dihydropteridine reductase isoform X1 [Frankliniella occidentalis]|uniref:Dihydropteridine reductase n=2 Tax=Frankliniella occidentalis TaxID=133901 RepID=A0A6J1T2S2_FRAOC|nr:dihydropteridine reductase isoform X1 [Frankliniella occidentalis]
MSFSGRVVIYGGKGALGAACVKHFKNNNWWVASIDMKEMEEADASIVVEPSENWTAQETQVLSKVKEVLGDEKVEAIINVAGGWAGGHAGSKDFIANADLMWRQSVWSSCISAAIAAKHLKEGGVVTLPGAKAATAGTPGMIGYGIAKAAIHQLTQSLAAPNSGLPANSFVASILPITLDTPMNRKWMPDADTSSWTSLEYIADLFLRWSKNEGRPASGSLVGLVTKNGQTETVIV